MQRFKKMLLVPATNEAYSRHLLPSVLPQLANLDVEIRQILENKHLGPDVKLQRYNHLLRRYMKLRDELGVDNVPAQSEDGQQPQGHASPPHQRVPESTILPFSDESILEGIPSRNLKSARLLISYLKRNREISWTKKGEMLIHGEIFPSTHLIDLVHDFSRARKSVAPAAGAIQLARALRRQNVPREGVGNPARWKLVEQHPGALAETARVLAVASPVRNRDSEYQELSDFSGPRAMSTPYRSTWEEQLSIDDPTLLE